MPGFDVVETLVIDDGSTDAHGRGRAPRPARPTCSASRCTPGLARAFSAGLDAALKLGADVIVNTDADNQYPGPDIVRLVQPILAGQAEMVIGDRDAAPLEHFGLDEAPAAGLGSWVVRQLSGTTVPDATSGFRAFSRRAALRLNVFTKFTYTLETIIQAGKKHIPIAHVPIAANPDRGRRASSADLDLPPALDGHADPHLRALRAAQGLRRPRRPRGSPASLIGIRFPSTTCSAAAPGTSRA